MTAYINEPVGQIDPEVAEKLRRGMIDWIFFTSSSTARNFFQSIRDIGMHPRVSLVSIGPKTSQTIREWGYEPDAEAMEHTLEGMLDAVRKAEQAS